MRYRHSTVWLAGALAGSFISAQVSLAQSATASDGDMSEVVVTGSRLVTDGSLAPTPVTVVSTDFLSKLQTTNLPQALQTLPQFTNSLTNNRKVPINGANAMGNVLNLRGLGATRTLVLFDGARVPGTGNDGTVNSNVIPELLIQRVDVVTGGASAAYGSDAVSGVVNFILDRNFTGIKAVAQSGISSEGDANTYRIGTAYGGSMLDERMHLLASAEFQKSDPITSIYNRPLGAARYLFTGQGTAANPWRLTPNAIYANASYGGVVNNGPFAGQQFLPGGALAPFNPGTPTGTNGINQGTSQYQDPQWMTAALRDWKVFARTAFELTNSLELWAQGTYSETKNTEGYAALDFRLNNLTIFSGNAFLTPAQQAALGSTPSFTMSRLNRELDPGSAYAAVSKVQNFAVGLRGSVFDAWRWEVTAQRGEADTEYWVEQANNTHFFAALDAVLDPSGNVVCRVTMTNPGLYPGCVPLNLFGEGSPSSAAIAYIRDVSFARTVNETDIIGASIQGSPFSTWAGPVGLALGAEYRTLSLDQSSNSNPAAPPAFTGIRGVPNGTLAFYANNTGITVGSANVKEAFVETAIPLAKGARGFQSLEANLAARLTDYSVSGNVTAWKAGLSWMPLDSLRFRATRSRDIRAPDLNALFAFGTVATPLTLDPHTNVSRTLNTFSGGNPNLEPEESDTTVFGFVYSPGWLDGLTITADYFQINIDGAIASLNAVQILSTCEASNGTAPECALITRPLPFSDRTAANFPASVRAGPVNASVFEQDGVDFEVGYRHALRAGTLQARLLGNWLPKYVTQASPIALPFELAGQSGAIDSGGGQQPYPKLRMTLQGTYSWGRYGLTLTEQYIGSMKQSHAAIVVPEDLHVSSKFYTALSLRADFMNGAVSPYVAINNLFNTQPPIIPQSRPSPAIYYPTAQQLYDTIGRFYTAGINIRF